jgi:hypothetical protein
MLPPKVKLTGSAADDHAVRLFAWLKVGFNPFNGNSLISENHCTKIGNSGKFNHYFPCTHKAKLNIFSHNMSTHSCFQNIFRKCNVTLEMLSNSFLRDSYLFVYGRTAGPGSGEERCLCFMLLIALTTRRSI